MASDLGWQYDTYPEVRAVLDKGGARVATAREYADWVEGHLWNRWGTHDYDFNSGKGEGQIYILSRDTDLPPLSAALALKIIVPQGVRVNITGGLGDNEVYFMEDYTARMNGNHKLQIYDDTLEVLGKEGYYAESFMYAKPRPAEEFNQKVVRPNVARLDRIVRKGTTRQMATRAAKFRPKEPQG